MSRPTRRRRRLTIATGAVLALTPAACSDDGGGTGSPTTPADTGATTSAPESRPGTPDGSTPSATTTRETTPTAATTTAAERDPRRVLQTSERSVRGSQTVVLKLTNQDDDDSYDATARGRVDGSNQQSVYTFAGGGRLELRIVGGAHYVKANQRYWSSQDDLAPRDRTSLADKWITVPQDKSRGFASQSIGALLDDLRRDLAPDRATTTNTTLTSVTHEGKPAYRLVRTDDDDPNDRDEDITLIVSADGRHLPLQASQEDDTVTFSEWNSVDPIAKPTGPTAPFPTPTDD